MEEKDDEEIEEKMYNGDSLPHEHTGCYTSSVNVSGCSSTAVRALTFYKWVVDNVIG